MSTHDTSTRTEVPLPAGISNNYTAGGMTYLQMLRRLREECGVSGSAPASVKDLPGEMARLANYINQAWLDIQMMHPDWEFMKQPISFLTKDGQQKYAAVEMQVKSLGHYKLDSFTCYPLGDRSQEQELPYMQYDIFRRLYMFGSRAEQKNRPLVFTIDGQRDFLLGEIPNGQYQITGEGWAMPTELKDDDDRPACPGQFHMAIVYRAMIMYGRYEAAGEVVEQGALEFNKLIARMALDQLPRATFGGTLA